jgi:Gpi18-like mannosyltransferase
LAAFNPAIILNSAAWGQMDSVLCILLLIVALYAMEEKWHFALPVYMLSVLVKPQALMLGPLGLVFIIMTLIHDERQRKPILYGTLISLAVLAAGVFLSASARTGTG